MKWQAKILGWLMLCVTGTALGAPPSSINATYAIYKSNLKIGQINETFSLSENHYSVTSTTRAVGLLALFQPGKISIISSGMVNVHGLQPLHYIDHRDREDNRNRGAEFNWTTKKLTLTHEAKSNIVPLQDGTQDRLSAMYQFMFLSLGKSDSLNFYMTNGSKVDTYNYRITHNQSVTVPLGTFKALYLDSIPEADASKTEIWLATEHNNFPYKMIITDKDGDKLIQVLTNIDFVP